MLLKKCRRYTRLHQVQWELEFDHVGDIGDVLDCTTEMMQKMYMTMLCVMGDRVQSHSQSDTGDVLDRAVEMT